MTDAASPEKQIESENTGPPAGGRINGRFAPGCSGNVKGRPRGYDFRAIVAEHAAKSGTSIAEVIAEIFVGLAHKAKGGDVNAAKLLLDRLCTGGDGDSATEFAARVHAALIAMDRLECR